MAARFWVGGTGNWDAATTTHWGSASGVADNASVPTSADDVTFDSASNATAYTVTITATANCANLTMAAPLSGKVTWAGSSAINIFGNLNLSGGTAGITRSYTGVITFKSTTTGKTITFNGVTMASATTYDGIAGGWTLQDTWNNSTSDITLTNGALDTNGQTITLGNFSSNNSNTRTLTLGASAITASGQSTPWNFATTSGLTFNANSSSITLSGNLVAFNGGGQTYNTVSISGTANPSGSTMSGSNTFANLTLQSSGAGQSGNIILSANQTITTLLTVNGSTARILVKSSSIGTTITLTAASVSLTNCDFQDITGAGAATWSGTSVGNVLGNTNITFTTPVTRYWMAVSGGSWSATSSWASSSGGGTGASVPLAQDTVIFDANSITSGSRTITADMPRLGKDISFTGILNTPAFSLTIATGIVTGSLTLDAGMTVTTQTNTISFESRSSVNFTTGGLTAPIRWQLNAFGGTVVQIGNLTTAASARQLTVVTGTWNMNGNNLSISSFITTGGLTSTLTLGTGTLELMDSGTVFNAGVNMTLNANTSTIKLTDATASAKSIAGSASGFTFNNFWITGAGSGQYNIQIPLVFNDFKDDGTVAHTINFTQNLKQTVTTFTVSGTAGQLITLQSALAGTFFYLRSTSGTINCNYLTLKDSNVGGGATWNAGANSTFTSNNVGWNDFNRFWVTGGDGNWNNTNNWSTSTGGASGASVPDGANAVFDGNSGNGTSTINAVVTITGIDCTGFTGTLAGSSAVTFYGNLKFVSGMSISNTSTWTGIGISTSRTLTSGTKSLGGNVTLQNSGLATDGAETWTLQDAFNCGAGTLTLTNGTFNANNFGVSCAIFSSSNSNTRTITMGNGTWTLTGNAATIWTTATITGLTFTRGNAIVCNYNGATGTRTISSGSMTEGNAPSFSITAGTDIVAITTNVLNLDFTGFAGSFSNGARTLFGNLLISTGMTVTAGASATTFSATSGTKTITSNTKNLDFPMTFNGVGGTFQFADTIAAGTATSRAWTLTNGTLDLNGKTITHFGTFTPGAGSGTRVLAFNAGTYNNTLTTTTTIWNYSGTNFSTTSVGGGTIKISGNTANVRTFAGGGATYPDLWFTNATTLGQLSITGSNTFADFKCTDTNTQSIKFTAGTTTTVTTFTVTGAASNLITIASITAATHTLSKSSGTVNSNYLSITNSIATGGAVWNAGSNSFDGGGNTGWVFGSGSSNSMFAFF